MNPILPPPLQLVIAGTLMYAINRGTSAWLSTDTSTVLSDLLFFQFDGQRLAYYIIAGIGILIIFSGIWSFKQAKTTTNPIQLNKASSLVTSGSYRYTRNPMYLGLVIILIGWGIRLGSVLSFVVIPLFIVVMTKIQIKPEERMLSELFGDEFVAYCGKVRRWV